MVFVKDKNIMMRHVCFFILLFCTFSAFSQNKRNIDSVNVLRSRIINGDTSLVSAIPEVKIYPRYTFNGWWDYRRYLRLVRNVKAAYPYAKIAGEKLRDLNVRLSTINGERQRKAFIEYTEDQLRGEFENALKHLTVSQGKILIKLIYRETGNTSFQVLKDLKGNFSAGFWQTVARIFGNNLKSKYDPYDEDVLIEIIINMIDSGQI